MAEVVPTPSDCPIFHFFLAEAWDIRPLLTSRVRMNEGTETAAGVEMTSEREKKGNSENNKGGFTS